MSAESRVDVVVIGAGLAGLVAAEALVNRRLEVKVLEARDRVGGRTYSRQIAGQAVDMGAEHVGANHHRVLGLAQRLGLRTENSGLFTAKTRWQAGGVDKISNVPPVSLPELARSVKSLARLSRQARKLPLDQPWLAPEARFFDGMSLGDWLDAERVQGRAREVHDALWKDGFTVEPEQISMLHVLWAARRSGGMVKAMRDAVGYHVDGGTQGMALGLADRLGPRVELGKAAVRVEQDDDEVNVVTEDGENHRAAQAIVCAPVPTLDRIDFAPSLPEELEEIHRELSFGRSTSIVVGARSAPEVNFGMVTGNAHFGTAWRRGPTAKAKPLDVASDSIPALAGEVARASAIPAHELEVESVAWPDEPFTRGTYVAFAPGQLTRFGPHLRRPHGRVHFAAAERSSWPTFMEGAIESGDRAASDVLVAREREGFRRRRRPSVPRERVR